MKQFPSMCCILTALLLCSLSADAVTFTREDYTPDLAFEKRGKTAPQVMMYPEVQYKYALFQNFLGTYIDRPLFFNRALRYPAGKFAYNTQESYFRDIAIMKQYGFDGAGSLALPIFGLYQTVNRFLENDPARAKGHLEFPQFAFGETGSFAASEKQLDTARKILNIALKSPYAPKINGRIPVTTYNSGQIKPEAMKKFLDALRKEFGNTFAVTGELLIDWQDRIQMTKTGKWTPETQEKYRRRLTEVLTLFDGLQIPLAIDTRRNNYMTEPDFRIYDRHLLPMIKEAMRKKEFKEKLFGSVIRHAYVNHMSGVTHGEFGTARLRLQLDRLIKLDPDFIVFFEWNEFNENTCFQPTLCNSLALQRLIRYYSNLLKGNPPCPNPGDNTEIPPLIFSSREAYRTGEPIRFELLNVPDTQNTEHYQAALTLLDAGNQEIGSFPVETFDRSKLRAVTYQIPTEQFSMQTVIRPVLKVTPPNGKKMEFRQLQTLRIHPTVCTNYKETRQPLRDLILPAKAEFNVKRLGGNTYEISGSFDAGEVLASLEVTDHGREIFAVDPSNEFDRTKNLVICGTISTRTPGMRNLQIQVANAPGWKFRPWEQANISFGSWSQNGDTVNSNTHIWAARNQMLLTIPRSADRSEIHCSVNGERHTLKIKDLLNLQKYAQLYQSCRIDWEICHELPDIPPQIGKNTASFHTQAKSLHKYPLFQLRAVTISGKIWRGQAVLPDPVPPASEKLNIHSETSGGIVTVDVPSALIPDLRYAVRPECGALLKNSFDPVFDAQLGGGFVYDEPAHTMPLPKNRSYAPVYTKDEEGKPALRFSGISYINFPLEAFPRGSFTLNFEIKPDAQEKPYVLFRHFSWILGSVTVYVKYDRLYTVFADRDLKVHSFASGFELKPGEWSNVTIAFDQKKLTFRVNGKSRSYKIASPLVPLYFKPAIFGGHTKQEFGLPPNANFYSGLLRKFEIRHNAEEQ